MAMLRSASEMKDSGIEWVGQIPTDWHISKLKYLGTYINGFAFKPSDWSGKGKPIIRIQDLTGSNNGEPNYYNGKLESKYLVSSGDILVSWAATLDAFVWNNGEGWLNQHIFKAIPVNTIDKHYYLWLLKVAMDNMNNDNKHGIVMQHVTTGVFNNYQVPLAPRTEQHIIANYLDNRCSKIDEIIGEATASIEEYKELKQAVIFETVTKGYHKKSSLNYSLDWCDTGICNEWDVLQIRYLYRLRNERNEKPLKEVNLISLYTDKGVVQHADLDKTTGKKAVTADGYKLVYPEDIIVNIILCWMGAMGRCEYYGVTSPAYDIYEPTDLERVCSRYYHYLFRTDRFAGKCYTLGRGIMMMRWRTYSSEFKSIKVPVPPYSEQVAIADYLDKRIRDMDALIFEKQVLIDDLQAYKKSLIYEIVTGKRRVV